VSIAHDTSAIADADLSDLFASFPASGRVILAVSGGADSSALMMLACRWRAAHADGPELIAATVDHGLRAGAHAEADAVGLLAQKLGIPHEILIWKGKKPATGIEAAARDARYRLLTELAQRRGATAIATAHTLDDQAETVLMRLAAGSGPAGLAGMRPKEVRDGVALLRPLLGIPKRRLVATLERDGIPWSEDPMNANLAFARPRLRAAAPALAREGLTPQRVARLAERIARYEQVVAAATRSAREALLDPQQPGRIAGHALLAMPEELALRLLGEEIAAVAATPCGGGSMRLQRLEALWSDVRRAIAAGRTLRRTLAGALVSVNADGSVLISRAPPRRTIQGPTRAHRAKHPFTKRQ